KPTLLPKRQSCNRLPFFMRNDVYKIICIIRKKTNFNKMVVVNINKMPGVAESIRPDDEI
ncbi:hypothetical protein OZK63_43105, partial [Streptomyces sp. UMAF16]|nr:hypothetical protein [Streptomyces sp. UMAF16]